MPENKPEKKVLKLVKKEFKKDFKDKAPDKEYLPMFFASCPEGLEELLVEELEQFKLKPKRSSPGGIYFICSYDAGLKFMFKTRIASRLYLKVHQFVVETEKDIYENTKNFGWEEILNVNQTFKIQTKLTRSIDGVRKSKFTNNIYLSQLLKDSIVDFFNRKFNKRPDVDKDRADVQIMMHVYPENKNKSFQERVDLFIDLSGNPLTNSCYRRENFSAPLRENLAAGLAMFMVKFGKKQNHLVDLMTGSGTLIIEYAYLRAEVAPTYIYLKEYFEENKNIPWIFYKQVFYKKNPGLRVEVEKFIKELYLASKENLQRVKNFELIASDFSNKNLTIAKECFYNAEIAPYVQTMKKDATKFEMAGFEGLVFANPPYGERLGESEKLESLYYELGENLKKNFKNSEAFIITSNKDLMKKISLRTSKKIPVFNGDLECRFLKYDLF